MELLQLAINGVVSASLYALVAIGFGVVYRTSGFLHFGHAATFAVAPYAALALTYAGFPLILALTAGVVVSSALGALTDVAVFRPLRHRQAQPLILFIASLGLFILLQNTISLLFGDDVQSLRTWQSTSPIAIANARITTLQVMIIAISFSMFGLLGICLRRTRFGLLVRATANDPPLASVTGIRSDRVILTVFALASGVGGLAGILSALDTDMTPSMGVNILFLGIAAFIIGGARNMLGGFAGALVVAFTRQAGAWYLGAKWQEPVVFALILAVFLVRPSGLSLDRVAHK